MRGYVAEEMSECQKKKRGGIVCDCLLTMEVFEYQTPTNRATFGLLFRIHENCIFGFLRLIIAKGTREELSIFTKVTAVEMLLLVCCQVITSVFLNIVYNISDNLNNF